MIETLKNWKWTILSTALPSLLAAWLAWNQPTAEAVPYNVAELQAQVASLTQEKDLYLARANAYMGMKQRRDAAIEASDCKVDIRAMIKDPDKIPKPWNPHGQLDAPDGSKW
jgi:hypothetical protein